MALPRAPPGHSSRLKLCSCYERESRLTLLDTTDEILEEVDGQGLVGREVGPRVDSQELVALPLRLEARRELDRADLRQLLLVLLVLFHLEFVTFYKLVVLLSLLVTIKTQEKPR